MTIFQKLDTPACGCDQAATTGRLMPVRDAVAAALARAAPVAGTEEVPLRAARGRCLAAPVRARSDMPRFDNAGMDGYACRAADLAGGHALPVRGVAAAGAPSTMLPAGTMMRIYTGAPIPAGADTVVMQEQVTRNGVSARVTGPVRPGSNIRRAGEDHRAGDELLPAGTVLDARHLAICAGAGAGTLTLRRRPRVALLLTGDEIAAAGAALGDGAIWDVNTPMLGALCEAAGAEIAAVRSVPDTRAALRAALAELAGMADLVVTSGGVSVGDRDHVKPALIEAGAHIALSGVAIKPGKPVTLARLDGTPVLCLPGNPVSAFVTWHVLGRPLLDRLAGAGPGAGPQRRHVRASAPLGHKPGRCEYRPARIVGYDSDGREVIACADRVESGKLGPLTEADGLILIPAETERVAAGDMLEFLPV